MKDKEKTITKKKKIEITTKKEYICVVPGCNYNHNEVVTVEERRKRKKRVYKTKDKELKYYLFPKNAKRCKKWLLAINPDKPKIINSPIDWKVCARHFDKSCFLSRPKDQLRQDAIPSLGLEKTSNGKPKLLSIGTDNAVNFIMKTGNFMDLDNMLSEDSKVDVEKVKKTSTNIVNPRDTSKCSVSHCQLGLADGVELFNLPKASSSKVKITNKEGISEVIDIRTAWIKLAGISIEDSLSKTNIKICSKHFPPHEITRKITDKGLIKKPKKYVVPSLNLTCNKKDEELSEDGKNEVEEEEEVEIEHDEILNEQIEGDQTFQENDYTGKKQCIQSHQKSRRKKDCELKLLPVDLENEELELFDDCVPPTLCTALDLNSEPMACNIDSGISQLTQTNNDQHMVPMELMEVNTQEEIAENKIASLDISDLCRVCTCYSIDSILIFSEEGDRLQLQRKIQQYLNIKVDESETEMPQGVCIHCIDKLDECDKLQNRAHDADKQFRHALEQKNAAKLQIMEDFEEMKDDSEECENADEFSSISQIMEVFEEMKDDSEECENVEESPSISQVREQKSNNYHNANIRKHMFMRNVVTYPNNYPCELCSEFTGTTQKLIMHMHDLHDKELCPFCYAYFSNEEELFKHVAETHSQICTFCNATFNHKKMFKYHFKDLHQDKLPVFINLIGRQELDCKLCGEHFLQNNILKAHYFFVHMHYACDICLQLFKNSDEQIKHTEEVHVIPCPRCDVKSYTYRRFKLHLNTHTSHSSNRKPISKSSEQIYECKFCYKGLCTKENVKRHNFWCHSQHTCIICLATFSNAESEEHHFKTHGHICICCEVKFKTKNVLDEHLLEIHPNFLPFMCNNCGDTYKTRNELNEHVSLTHKKKNKYLCDICGIGFSMRQSVTSHQKIQHSGVKLTCNFCNRLFKCKTQLKMHFVYKHSGSKKYKCLDCKLSYSTAKSLNIHMLKHSSYHVRPQKIKCHLCNFKCTKQEMPYHVGISHSESSVYKCNVCNKMLVQEKDMILHTSCHLKEELSNYDKYYVKVSAYLCDKCNELFVNKNNLESHMKIHSRKNYKAKTAKKCI